MQSNEKHKGISWKKIITNIKLSIFNIIAFFIPGAMIIHSEKIAEITNIPTSVIVKLSMFITVFTILPFLLFYAPDDYE